MWCWVPRRAPSGSIGKESSWIWVPLGKVMRSIGLPQYCLQRESRRHSSRAVQARFVQWAHRLVSRVGLSRCAIRSIAEGLRPVCKFRTFRFPSPGITKSCLKQTERSTHTSWIQAAACRQRICSWPLSSLLPPLRVTPCRLRSSSRALAGAGHIWTAILIWPLYFLLRVISRRGLSRRCFRLEGLSGTRLWRCRNLLTRSLHWERTPDRCKDELEPDWSHSARAAKRSGDLMV